MPSAPVFTPTIRQPASSPAGPLTMSAAIWYLLSPLLVITLTFAVFHLSRTGSHDQDAQLTGFVFYWAIAGVVIPLLLVGRRGYVDLFASPSIRWSLPLRIAMILLFLPAAFGFLFAFPLLFPVESSWLLPTLAAYALINGTLEEVFWRGLFMKRFPRSVLLGVLYPAAMFAVWQLVPWALFHSWLRPPALLVLLVSLSVGVLFNWIAWRTGSIRWTALAHVLTNLSGIGALMIFAPPG